jgi:hypothetical protein
VVAQLAIQGNESWTCSHVQQPEGRFVGLYATVDE